MKYLLILFGLSSIFATGVQPNKRVDDTSVREAAAANAIDILTSGGKNPDIEALELLPGVRDFLDSSGIKPDFTKRGEVTIDKSGATFAISTVPVFLFG